MDPILQVFLSWQFILCALAISIIVYTFRSVIEYLAATFSIDLATSKFWNEVFLPILPIAIGVVGSLYLAKFPYPGFTPNAAGFFLRGDRLIFGIVTGGFSTTLYRVVKSLLTQKISVILTPSEPDTTPPNISSPQIQAQDLPPRGKL